MRSATWWLYFGDYPAVEDTEVHHRGSHPDGDHSMIAMERPSLPVRVAYRLPVAVMLDTGRLPLPEMRRAA